MPYNYPDNVPDAIKGLPAAAQKLWISKFNEVLDSSGDEQSANVAAWGMVKRTHTKAADGSWVRKEAASDTALVLLESLGTAAPEWIRVLRLGENKLADGRDPFYVDKGSMKKILDAFEHRGNDLVVDYEHQTMNTGNGGTAPAAGWIKELEARDDGLWARIEWTDKAKGFIGAREYRYFSPVVSLTEGRKVKELLNVALTNFPALAKLEALAAKYGELDIEILGASEKDKAAQEARAKKFSIGIKDGGNVTKPAEWASVPDEQFADPVNYAYPMPNLDQTVAAWRYWNVADNQKAYNSAEQKIITERIQRRGKALGKELQTGARSNQGGFSMDKELKKILGLSEDASDLDVVLALKALKETADQVPGLRTQVEEATDKAVKAENKATEAAAKVTSLEAMTNKVAMPMMLTSALGLDATVTVEAALAKVESLKAQVTDGDKAKQDLVALRTELVKKDAENEIDKAVRQGRTTPAELAKDGNRLYDMAFKDLETFKAIMGSRPDAFMAPVGQKLDVMKDDKGNAVILDADDKAMCKSLGIPEEDFLKAKKEAAEALIAK
jgi:phage I-like protein/cation transport regulator ChaB